MKDGKTMICKHCGENALDYVHFDAIVTFENSKPIFRLDNVEIIGNSAFCGSCHNEIQLNKEYLDEIVELMRSFNESLMNQFDH